MENKKLLEQNNSSPSDLSNDIYNIIINGNLNSLNPNQKIEYYQRYCESCGLNPVTRPFEYLELNKKLILYCTRSGGQQLSKKFNLKHEIIKTFLNKDFGTYEVTVRASDETGRFEDNTGAVDITYPETITVWKNGQRFEEKHPKAGQFYKGIDYANAIMKAETKAKRRATLDFTGLGIPDESEIEHYKPNLTLPPDTPEPKAKLLSETPKALPISGPPVIVPIPEKKPKPLVTNVNGALPIDLLKKLQAKWREKGITDADFKKYLIANFNIDSTKLLTYDEFTIAYNWIDKYGVEPKIVNQTLDEDNPFGDIQK